MFGPIAIDMHKIFVGDLTQPPAQFVGNGSAVELGVIVHDGPDRIDMMGDQFARHLFEVGRVLDEAAQAFGCGCRRRISEGCGVALDIVGGAEELLASFRCEAVLEQGGMGRREPVPRTPSSS